MVSIQIDFQIFAQFLHCRFIVALVSLVQWNMFPVNIRYKWRNSHYGFNTYVPTSLAWARDMSPNTTKEMFPRCPPWCLFLLSCVLPRYRQSILVGWPYHQSFM